MLEPEVKPRPSRMQMKHIISSRFQVITAVIGNMFVCVLFNDGFSVTQDYIASNERAIN
jgi:hypothetical protein